MLENKSILVTGGTGSFGRRFIGRILEANPDIGRLVIYSRDELKQFDMSQQFPESEYPGIRYFLGDMRDERRLNRALEGIDIVIHAAALKQVPAAEYNPFEFIKTNIIGAQNLIEACLTNNVERVIALSTDKAAAPVNLYGATKLCSDKLFVAANNIVGSRPLRFTVVRYGNVMGSRGSVIPFFLKQRETGTLPITHPDMTRFNITLDEAVDMVLWTVANTLGGEIIVPKIPSYRIMELAEAIAPDAKTPVVGIRPGEKLHEEMIVPADAANTVDLGDYYAIVSAVGGIGVDAYAEKTGASRMPDDFHYISGANDRFLSVAELRDLIAKHVDTGSPA